MRSLKLAGLVAFAGVIAVALFFGLPLLGTNAAVTHANGGGAQVFHDGSCAISAGASGLDISLGPSDQTGYQKVLTPSGNAVLICKFAIPEGYEPAKAIKNRGFTCNIGGIGLVTNSQSIASPGGNVTLRCQYKAE